MGAERTAKALLWVDRVVGFLELSSVFVTMQVRTPPGNVVQPQSTTTNVVLVDKGISVWVLRVRSVGPAGKDMVGHMTIVVLIVEGSPVEGNLGHTTIVVSTVEKLIDLPVECSVLMRVEGFWLAVTVNNAVEVTVGRGLAVEMLVSLSVVVNADVTSTVDGGE